MGLSEMGYRTLMMTARGYQIKMEKTGPTVKSQFRQSRKVSMASKEDVGDGAAWMKQKRRCKNQRRGVPVIGDGWNPQVVVKLSRST